VQAGVADVRITGTVHLESKTKRAHQLRGTLAIEIVKNDLAGQRRVLDQRVRVSGEYSIDGHEATLAALDHDGIAVLHFGFARGAKSYLEHDGIRYPTTCELKRP